MPITPIPDYTCLTDEQVHELQAECQVLIAAVSERIHYAESRRGMLATIGAALVAARVATVAGAISILDKAEWWIACAVTGLCLTMTGLSIWFLYARQTNRYPWTGGTTTWKWFYRDALPDSNALRFGATSYFWGWRTTESRIRRAFISQLSDFRLRFIQLKDKKTSLDQDIQQLYVLHVNEEYKNLHLSHLRTTMNVGLIGSLIIAFAISLPYVFRSFQSEPVTRSVTISGQLKTEVLWHPLPTLPSESMDRILINALTNNQSPEAVSTLNTTLYDRAGLQVPFATLQSVQTVTPLAAKASGLVAMVVRVPYGTGKTIARVEITP